MNKCKVIPVHEKRTPKKSIRMMSVPTGATSALKDLYSLKVYSVIRNRTPRATQRTVYRREKVHYLYNTAFPHGDKCGVPVFYCRAADRYIRPQIPLFSKTSPDEKIIHAACHEGTPSPTTRKFSRNITVQSLGVPESIRREPNQNLSRKDDIKPPTKFEGSSDPPRMVTDGKHCVPLQ